MVVAPSPSTTVTSLIESVRVSSLVMVPTPRLSASVALDALLRVTEKLSSASIALSPCTITVICCAVMPGANVRVPVWVV